jgi:hypothetical protein
MRSQINIHYLIFLFYTAGVLHDLTQLREKVNLKNSVAYVVVNKIKMSRSEKQKIPLKIDAFFSKHNFHNKYDTE